ncbi:MAG: ABC transporter substrate-binding protein [Candidatus Bipolaricaulota bacterium]
MGKFCAVMLAGLLALGVAGFGQVEITFWHAMGVGHAPALEQLVQDFMGENPEVTVDLVYQGGYGDLSTKLLSAVAAGTPPTMAQQYENWTTQWVDALADLDQYMDAEALDDVHERFVQEFDGRLVTVPFNKSIIILYYRKDLVPEPPTTWEEFLDMAAELTVVEDGEVVQYGTGLRPPNVEIFLMFLEQVGGSILSEDWTEVTINDERGVETAEFMAELSEYALVQGGYLSEPFGEGAIAMFVDTSAGYPYNLSAAEGGGYEMGVSTVPYRNDPASMVQGTNLAIFEMGQSQEQVQAAGELIEFLLRPENTIYWAQETGYLPVTTRALESALWESYCEDNPERGVMTEEFLAGGFGQILHPDYWDMRSLMQEYYELLLMGEMGPAEALDALADEIEFLIQ